MDKQKIAELYLKSLEEKIKKLEESLGMVKKQVKEAPSAMESHSDTSRFQADKIAGGIEQNLAALKKQRAVMNDVAAKKCEKPEPGAVIILKDKDSGEELYYFLVNGQGGDVLGVDGKKVNVISSESPLAQAGINFGPGQSFEFRERKFEILVIQ